MLIEQPSKWLRWIYPKALWRINPEEHAVYLTFDDGPIPESTPFILDTLKEYGAKATFFMVGENVVRHPDLYRRILDEGHQVGNHTYNHIGSLRHYIITYYNNVEKANEVIHSHLFRPPHGWMWLGAYNMLRRKYKIVMWDLVTSTFCATWCSTPATVPSSPSTTPSSPSRNCATPSLQPSATSRSKAMSLRS